MPVEINGVITLNFVLDTGASEVNIPADVVLTLYRAGTIRDADFLPGQTYRLADGSKVNSSRFVLRSLKIGQRRITNVAASIGSVSSSLLLGQSFLEKLGAWGIDGQSQTLVIGRLPKRDEAQRVSPDNTPSPTKKTLSTTGVLYYSDAGSHLGSAYIKTGSQLLHFTLSWRQSQFIGFSEAGSRANDVGAIWSVRYSKDSNGSLMVESATFSGKRNNSIHEAFATVKKYYGLLILRRHVQAYNLFTEKKKSSTDINDLLYEGEMFISADRYAEEDEVNERRIKALKDDGFEIRLINDETKPEEVVYGIKPEIISHTRNMVRMQIDTHHHRKRNFRDYWYQQSIPSPNSEKGQKQGFGQISTH